MALESTNTRLVKPEDVHSFVVRTMTAAGTDLASANALGDVITASDTRGVFSHGLNRLGMYVDEVQSGQCSGTASPTIIKETPATAFVNGNNGIGMRVGQFCMDLAIAKAKNVGVAWVTCTGSNHYGMACYYTQRAAENGLIGLSVTNTSPLVVPPGTKKVALGSNPLSFAAPAKDTDDFVLDMATSAVAYGKIEMSRRMNLEIPDGWGVDCEGRSTHDPNAVLNGGGLVPMAGVKGYGIAMMVDILSGVLSGGPSGPHVKKWLDTSEEANLGQTFIALDPNCFAPNFDGRLTEYMNEMRGLPAVDPSRPVMIAGDPEMMKVKAVKDNGGINYDVSLITAMEKLASKLKIEPMKVSD